MTAKKKTNIVIDMTTVKSTLSAFNVEIKSQRKTIESEYKALRKKEDALWQLEDKARNLEHILKLGKTFKAVAA